MKKSIFLFITLFVIALSACKDDNCHDALSYKNHSVDFYSTHKDFVIEPARFETYTETAEIQEAHKEGALFEVVSEQILVKESYKIYQIMDTSIIHIVTNSQIDSISELTCYHFFEESEFLEIEVPAEYITWNKLRVAQQGTGSNVPAIFATIARRVVVANAKIEANTNEQEFNRVVFKIPEGRSIRAHLGYSFSHHSNENCIEGNSYRIPD